METFMRAHHAIAIIVILVVGFAAKQFFFPPTKAEADISPGAIMNVQQMQSDVDMKKLPVQKMKDLSFVFDSE
jgi:hypothetical protein